MCILSKNACRHCMYESFLLAARCIQWFHIVHILDYGKFKQIPVKLWAIYSLGPVSIIRECSIGIMPSVCMQIAIQAVQTFQLLSAITAKYSFYIRQLDIQQSTWVHDWIHQFPCLFFREKEVFGRGDGEKTEFIAMEQKHEKQENGYTLIAKNCLITNPSWILIGHLGGYSAPSGCLQEPLPCLVPETSSSYRCHGYKLAVVIVMVVVGLDTAVAVAGP